MAFKGNFNGNTDVESFKYNGNDVNIIQLTNSTLSAANVWAKTLSLSITKQTGVASYSVQVTDPSLYNIDAYYLTSACTATSTLYANYGDQLSITATAASGYTISGGTGVITITSNTIKIIQAVASSSIVEGFYCSSDRGYVYVVVNQSTTDSTDYLLLDNNYSTRGAFSSTTIGNSGHPYHSSASIYYASASHTPYTLTELACGLTWKGTSYSTDAYSASYASAAQCTVTNQYSFTTITVYLTVNGTHYTTSISAGSSSVISGISLSASTSISYVLKIVVSQDSDVYNILTGQFSAYSI